MEIQDKILLWIIAFAAMLTHYVINLKKPFNIKVWLNDNYITLLGSSMSIIVLFLIFMIRSTLEALDAYVRETQVRWMIFFYKEIAAFVIGYFNIWLIQKLANRAKRKIEDADKGN